MRLGDLTWVEAEQVLTPERVVVLPLGAAAKEHGPHLLLRNDQILADYFAERVRQGCTVIMTTHILEVAERMAERIGVIAAGRLIEEGTLEELRLRAGKTSSTLEDIFLDLVDRPDRAA